jgi:hypothetical protein
MRRGLMAWDPAEIPIETLQSRVQRLRNAMAAAGQDAMILYTNFVRSAAVSHLTAFSPYWADGVLLVPSRGEPLFATTLSKRVGSWIQSVKPLGDLVTTPTPGTVLGKRLAEDSRVRRVAILERDAFPSGLYSELAVALPGIEIVDGSEAFARARVDLDDVERRLLGRAQTMAHDALHRLDVGICANAGVAAGAVEEYARAQGAEEVYVAIAPDMDADRRFLRLSGDRRLGRRFAIRATVAYKGAWVRVAKTYSRDGDDFLSIGRADSWFQEFVAGVSPHAALAEKILASVSDLRGAKLTDWMAEGPVGTRPLAAVASSLVKTDAMVHAPALVVTLGLTIDDTPWCGAGLVGTLRGNRR